MRLAYLLLTGLLLAGALPAEAGEADPEIYFSDASGQKVELRRFVRELDPTANNCASAVACRNLYTIEYVGREAPVASVTVPAVVSAQVNSEGFLKLDLSVPFQLAQAGTTLPLSSFRIVLHQLQLIDPPQSNRFEIPFGSTFFVNENLKTRGLVYRGLLIRGRPVGPVVVTVKDPESGVTLVYEDPKVEPYPNPAQPQSLLWQIELSPAPPRGRALDVTVTGIDDFQGGSITRAEKITFRAFPKGRDDATFYLKGQKVYNQKGDDQGSVDFKNERTVISMKDGSEVWYKIAATVGSKKLKISQTGTVSLGFRQWLGVDPDDLTKVSQWAVSVAPTFRTDRDFKNRDLGLDLALEGEPAMFLKTLERRRKLVADPSKIAVGWSIKPKLSIEAGRHIASASPDVEKENFVRGVPAVNLMWETDRAALPSYPATLRLTVDIVHRVLFMDEVTIDQNEALRIEDGEKPYLRAELGYDLGLFGLSVVHENGKLPPAFKTARATTVGLTFKF